MGREVASWMLLSQMQAAKCENNKPVYKQMFLPHPRNQLLARIDKFKLVRIAVKLACISKHEEVIALVTVTSTLFPLSCSATGTGPLEPEAVSFPGKWRVVHSSWERCGERRRTGKVRIAKFANGTWPQMEHWLEQNIEQCSVVLPSGRDSH